MPESMQVIDSRPPEEDAEDAFLRLQWMPLVLADMRDYASDRDRGEVAAELERCRDRINAILRRDDTQQE